MLKSEVVITLSGDIADFDRLDNIYRSLKREAPKLLDNYTLEIEVKYRESGTTAGA